MSITPDQFSGALSIAAPWDVLPGRAGVTPNVALLFQQGSTNNWTGMGWSLTASAIQRSTKLGVDFSADKFVYIEAGAQRDLTALSISDFRLKVESEHLRFTRTPNANGWVVAAKNGWKYYYGETAAGRISDPADAARVFSWLLERVEDADRNFYTLQYEPDGANKTLRMIAYTGNAGSPFLPANKTIEFLNESRPDVLHNYRTGFDLPVTRRLKEVRQSANNQVVKSLVLNYDLSPSQISLVSTMRTSFPSGAAFPPVSVSYADGGNSLTPSLQGPRWSDQTGWGEPKFRSTIRYPDLTGDGKPDLCARDSGGIICLIGNGSSFNGEFRGPGWSDAGGWGDSKYYSTIQYPDLNGDGKADLCARDAAGIVCLLGSGSGFSQEFRGPAWSDTGGWADPKYYSTIQYPDLNGDGKADICARDAGGLVCLLGTGAGFAGQFTGPAWSDSGGWGDPKYYSTIRFQDINGDGKSDVCARDSAGLVCLLGTGTGFAHQFTGPAWSDSAGWGEPKYYSTIQFADVNGDSLPDVCARSSSGVECFLGSGAAFTARIAGPQWSDAGGWGDERYYGSVSLIDLNGDLKADIVGRSAGGVDFSSSTGYPSGYPVKISNLAGGTTEFEYLSSTSFQNTALPFAVMVLSGLHANDGRGGRLTTRYEYALGYYSNTDKEFRGFGQVSVLSPASGGHSMKTMTAFHQGNAVLPENTDFDAPTGFMKGKPYRVEVIADSKPLSRTTFEYAKDSAPPYFNPLVKIETNTCNAVDCLRGTKTLLEYDSYGNSTKEIDFGDVADSTDDRTIVRTYRYDEASWMVAILSGEEVFAGADKLGSKLKATRYLIDARSTCDGAPSEGNTLRGGHVTDILQWDGKREVSKRRIAYDPLGNPFCTADALGNKSTMRYDSSGTYLLTTTNPLGQASSSEYHGVDSASLPSEHFLFGLLRSSLDLAGQRSSFEYDNLGRNTRTVQPGGNVWMAKEFLDSGDPTRQRVRVTSSTGDETIEYVDGLGRTYRKTSRGEGGRVLVVESHFDEAGRLSKLSHPFYLNTPPAFQEFSYDAVGRPTESRESDGSRVLQCHDDRNSVVIDQLNRPSLSTRTASGRVALFRRYAGQSTSCADFLPGGTSPQGMVIASTSYVYDALGNITLVTDPMGRRTSFSFNELGERIKVVDPDTGTQSVVFDDNGRISETSDGRGKKVLYRYDALGRVIQKDYNARKPLNQGDYVYNYDTGGLFTRGRLRTVRGRQFVKTFDYDANGRVKDLYLTIDGRQLGLSSEYDALGRVVSVRPLGGEAIRYEYDGLTLKRILSSSRIIAEFDGYDPDGHATRIRLGNGLVEERQYGIPGSDCSDRDRRLCAVKVGRPDATPLLSITPEFDAVGNLAYEVADGVARAFVYDQFDRIAAVGDARAVFPRVAVSLSSEQLTQALTALSSQPKWSEKHLYDLSGNITWAQDRGVYSYDGPGPVNAPKRVGSRLYQYDAAGSTTSDGARSFTYDNEGRLTGAIGATITDIAYDDGFSRIKVTSGGRSTLFVGAHLECSAIGCVQNILGPEGVIARVPTADQTKIQFLHSDHLNSTRLITGPSGNVVSRASRSAFGVVSAGSSISIESRFAGGDSEPSLGLVYFGTRYYDPTLGRFLTPDAFAVDPASGLGGAKYVYCNDNPVSMRDGKGRFAWFVPIIIGAVVGGIQAHNNGDDVLQGVLKGAVAGAFFAAAGAAGGGAVAQAFLHGAAGAAAGYSNVQLFGGGGNPLEAAKFGFLAGVAGQLVGGAPFGNSKAAILPNQLAKTAVRSGLSNAAYAAISGRDVGQAFQQGLKNGAAGFFLNYFVGAVAGGVASGFSGATGHTRPGMQGIQFQCNGCPGGITIGPAMIASDDLIDHEIIHTEQATWFGWAYLPAHVVTAVGSATAYSAETLVTRETWYGDEGTHRYNPLEPNSKFGY